MSKLIYLIYLILLSFTKGPNNINKYINEKYKQLITPDAIDLLYKMLEVDHSLRITAKDALNHPYLKSEVSNNKEKSTKKNSANKKKK